MIIKIPGACLSTSWEGHQLCRTLDVKENRRESAVEKCATWRMCRARVLSTAAQAIRAMTGRAFPLCEMRLCSVRSHVLIFSPPGHPCHAAHRPQLPTLPSRTGCPPPAQPALSTALSPIRSMAHHGDASKEKSAPTSGFMVGSPWPSIILYIPQNHPLMSRSQSKAMLRDDAAVECQQPDWLRGWGLVFFVPNSEWKHFFEDQRTEEKQNGRNMHPKFPLSCFANK